ncbi:porphobilinogen deaminase, dipyromethane cofactor binding domain-containing protein [Triangularia verruculosa]|uniref:Porphobilinogen deaminase n=1 Tax=Triangularia verruculosa TaxID=2587418 RepID=A0AAN7B0B5_9PEZI|nr:porphobilinogen deaminase, dipyromethane cofactor binding domain-containing protein [Triangularia verruculosa]
MASEQQQQESYTVKVGTRRSALAMAQTNLVIAALSKAAGTSVKFEVHSMATMGDRDTTTPLPSLGKGLWTSELEAKLMNKEVDVIVHSLKDMPTSLPEGCVLGAVTLREDARDVVVFPKHQGGKYKALKDLPEGSVVGTSSVRRAAQLKRSYKGLVFRDVRGNIDTRLAKCDEEGGQYDAIILAAAGLLRLGYDERIGQFLDSSTEGGGLLHAVGQGALGLEIREGDEKIERLIQAAIDRDTMVAAFAERSVMRRLEGGCSVPIGVETKWVEDQGEKKLRLKVTVVSLDGKKAVDGERTEKIESLEEAEALGKSLAEKLAAEGAQEILNVINKLRDSAPGALKVSDA